MQTDLAEEVYEKDLKKDQFIESYKDCNTLCSVLVVVPKARVDRFL